MLLYLYRQSVGIGGEKMRAVKEAEVRRNEILDAAQKLFIEKGFDGTSTNDILKAVGIARGTLYYHFHSKEQIMDALVERINDKLLERARKVAKDQQFSIEERLFLCVKALHLDEEGSEMLIEHIHRPQNALMQQKMQTLLVKGVTPILGSLIKEGIEKGSFDTAYPFEAMEIALIYMHALIDYNCQNLTEEQQLNKLNAFIYHFERMIGAKEGSLLILAKNSQFMA